MKKMVSVLLTLVCLLAFGQVSLAEETDAFLA